MLLRHTHKQLLVRFKPQQCPSRKPLHNGRVTATLRGAPSMELPQSTPVMNTDAAHLDAALNLLKRIGDITYMFTGATSALLQGVRMPKATSDVQLCVQWDNIKELQAQLAQEQLQPGPIAQDRRGQLSFSLLLQGMSVQIFCHLNTVLRMEPERVLITELSSQQQVWCQSLLSVRREGGPELAAAVGLRLQELQQQLTAANAQAWSQAAAEGAWLNKLGDPADTAAWICQDPWLRLGRPLFKHLPEQLSGLRVMNLMGSHGTKAVAAAVLGAHSTCVDISPVNAAYCARVAAAAGVDVHFIVADVLQLPQQRLNGSYDIVLLELGVLHYFLDLLPLLTVVSQLLRPGGKLLLREFHPVSTKLVTSKGKRHKVTGDYFSQDLVTSDVAYTKYSAAEGAAGTPGLASAASSVQLRQWELGEVVTAVCEAGLVLHCLEEEAGTKADDAGLPKLFTLVAAKLPCVTS